MQAQESLSPLPSVAIQKLNKNLFINQSGNGIFFHGIFFHRLVAVQVHTSGTIPTKTVHVPIYTGTVMDSGSVNTGLLVMLVRYTHRQGRL